MGSSILSFLKEKMFSFVSVFGDFLLFSLLNPVMNPVYLIELVFL